LCDGNLAANRNVRETRTKLGGEPTIQKFAYGQARMTVYRNKSGDKREEEEEAVAAAEGELS
jgi:hypothetical protein